MGVVSSLVLLPLIAGCSALRATPRAALGEVPVATTAEGASIVLAREGRAELPLFVESQAPAVVRYAAEELRGYLEKISGAQWKLATEPAAGEPGPGIFVGRTRAAAAFGIDPSQLAADGFLIASPRPDTLILSGRDHRGPALPGRPDRRNPDTGLDATADGVLTRYGETGTLFAVYRLLAELGVRWYLPGELGEVVPSLATVSLSGLPISDAPHAHQRTFSGFHYGRDREAAVWMKRIGAGAESYLNINHSYLEWPEKYGREHPGWFATIDGRTDSRAERRGRRPRVRNVIDFTEPGVLAQTVAEADAFFADPWPGRQKLAPELQRLFDTFPVMPNDSFHEAGEEARQQGLLTPDRGGLGEFSDYVWGFVNRVAQAVGESHPGKFVGATAYGKYTLPPTRLTRLAENVIVKFRQHRLGHWSPEYRRIEDEAFRGFAQLGPARMYVAEYYNLRQRYPSLAGVPTLAPHLIAENIRSHRDILAGEVVSIAADFANEDRTGRYTHTGLSHLNVYVTARALWDPEQDVDQLLDEYFELFYGPAKQPMSQFFALLEHNWMNPERHGSMRSLSRSAVLDGRFRFLQKRVSREDLFPAADVELLAGYLDQARARTTPGSRERQRVDFIRAEHSALGV